MEGRCTHYYAHYTLQGCDNLHNSIRFDFIKEDNMSIPFPMEGRPRVMEILYMGPWGSPNEGLHYNHNGYDGIKKMIIYSTWVIDSIQVIYTKKGQLIFTDKVGGDGGDRHEIVLEDGEYITEVEGYYGRLHNMASINSLTFYTNLNNIFGPYGFENGHGEEERAEVKKRRFHIKGGRIVGLSGTTGRLRFLPSIGFYNDIAKEVVSMGAWGYPEEGLSFNHNGYDGIKKIIIYSGWVIDSIEVVYTKNGELMFTDRVGAAGGDRYEITLEEDEYLTEVMGYYGRLYNMGSINSLTLVSNRNNRFGPYGLEDGHADEALAEVKKTKFHVKGGKIIGLNGTRGRSRFLPSIGFYVCSATST